MNSAAVGQVKLGAYERASLLLMKTLTPLHIGVGKVTGVVDLPIIRDAMGFPIIPTSSLKGALRSQLSGSLAEEEIKVLFGPEPGEEAYAGALAFTEGYLLAMPARSLRGIWALVTSPVLIHRFQRMLQMMRSLEPSSELEKLGEHCKKLLEEGEVMDVDQAIVCKEGEEKLSIEIMGKKSLILNEEFQFGCKQSENIRNFFGSIRVPEARRGILLHDDRIRDVVERSILRRARVRLKKEDKTVGEGPWSEEDVPAEALFFNVLIYSKPRKAQDKMKDVEDVKSKTIKQLLSDYEQKIGYAVFGGHETIGRGVIEFIGLVGCSL
jgi:CRISPR-associated protein Cmr4